MFFCKWELMKKQISKNGSATTECKEPFDSFNFQSEQWFYSLTKLIPDLSVQGYTTDGRVIFWNKASEEIYGYSKEEAIGKNLADLIIPDEITPKFLQCLEIGKAITKSGEFAPAGELLLLNKKGCEVPVYSIHTAIYNPGQETVLFCLDVDLSKRKEVEYQLQKLTQSLIETNKHLESILQIATHDLRTPMINVSGFSNEIKYSLEELEEVINEINIPTAQSEKIKKILSDEIPEYTRLVILGVSKIDTLLDGLVSLAHLSTAAMQVESLQMDSILQNVLHDFIYQCQKKSILLQTEPLPNCLGDRVQIQCVLTNLISNAIKYLDPTRKGIITVTGKKNTDTVVYRVQDNGVGIPNESIEKIFNTFYRTDPRSQDGQGLGLAIVKNIINKHNGQIWVESEPDKGSTFFFSIPVAK